MNEVKTKQNNLLDTTDCLEAMEVFRSRKNILFLIIIASLLALQASFWLTDSGLVKTEAKAENNLPEADTPKTTPTREQPGQVVSESNEIQKAAEEVTSEPNVLVLKVPQPAQKSSLFSVKFKHLAGIIRFFNFVLILAATLYCLTMLFSLKISLLCRLGGINHISRAFFLSLIMLVLLLPWQKFFGGVIAGAIYTSEELSNSCAINETNGILTATLFYLRFTGYWVLVLLLLIFAQWRSIRWAKATLRRLEVV